MKKFLFCTVFFMNSYGWAVNITCDVVDELRPPSWPVDQIVVEHDLSQISTINYLKKVPEDDGTFKDKAELLYSRTVSNPSVRGGREVYNCNPDINNISQTGVFSVYSQCNFGESNDQLYFDFRLNQNSQDGSFSIFIPTSTGDIERKGEFTSCK